MLTQDTQQQTAACVRMIQLCCYTECRVLNQGAFCLNVFKGTLVLFSIFIVVYWFVFSNMLISVLRLLV